MINISFIWEPGHSGIESNGTLDHETSKAASSVDTSIIQLITYADTDIHINEVLYIRWHKHWSKRSTTLNMMKKKKCTSTAKPWFKKERENDHKSPPCRIYILNTQLSHEHEQSHPLMYDSCGAEKTVKHIK